MKSAQLKVVLSLLLAVLLCFSVSCRDTGTPNEGENTQPPVETPDVISEFSLSDAYVLVRPDEKISYEVNALMLLGRGLESAYGCSFDKGTDYADAAEFEILVGATSRPESQEVLKTLAYYDWTYQVVSPNVIVICGGSPEATLTATEAFLRDVVGYTEDEEKRPLTPGSAAVLKADTDYVYRHEYVITSFTLGLHDLADYTLVATDVNSAAVSSVVHHFIRMTGLEIPVVALRDYKSGPAIFFGCSDKDGSHLVSFGKNSFRYYIQQSGDNIIIDFSTETAAAGAAKRFITACTPEEGVKGEFSVSFEGDKSLTGVHIAEGTNNLVLKSVTKREMAPGVIYEEHLYYDPNGKPVRAYMITVEPGAATIATSLPKDEDQIGRWSDMLNQVTAAANNGKNVLAGINADFFDIENGTKQMLGLCVRDGVLLHEVSGRPWFGITKDGQPVIGADYVYKKYEGNLLTAVGGSNIVLQEDRPFHISIDHEFGYVRHPRSAVGFKPDGSIVLLVVDGRQKEVSNGAALADVADILAMQGCSNGLNLDGGGSSTFVLKGEDGDYSITNSPSDPEPRPVADGLIVILPENKD